MTHRENAIHQMSVSYVPDQSKQDDELARQIGAVICETLTSSWTVTRDRSCTICGLDWVTSTKMKIARKRSSCTSFEPRAGGARLPPEGVHVDGFDFAILLLVELLGVVDVLELVAGSADGGLGELSEEGVVDGSNTRRSSRGGR